MSALDSFKIIEEPCPLCGGKVESWFFSSDCRGNEPSSGLNCTTCKRAFNESEYGKTKKLVRLKK